MVPQAPQAGVHLGIEKLYARAHPHLGPIETPAGLSLNQEPET